MPHEILCLTKPRAEFFLTYVMTRVNFQRVLKIWGAFLDFLISIHVFSRKSTDVDGLGRPREEIISLTDLFGFNADNRSINLLVECVHSFE